MTTIILYIYYIYFYYIMAGGSEAVEAYSGSFFI